MHARQTHSDTHAHTQFWAVQKRKQRSCDVFYSGVALKIFGNMKTNLQMIAFLFPKGLQHNAFSSDSDNIDFSTFTTRQYAEVGSYSR